MKDFIRYKLRLNITESDSGYGDDIKQVMKYIRNKNNLNEQMIDGQEMNAGTQSLCNTMSVRSYEEVIGRIIAAIGTKDENPEIWKKIEKPLSMLKKANYEINKEKRTDDMTGDSMVDEANTWWSAIQTTICEQGPEFQ
jgi:hypothetical protein